MTKATLSEVTKPISPEINGPAKKVTATFTFTAVFSSHLLHEKQTTPKKLTSQDVVEQMIKDATKEAKDRGSSVVQAIDIFRTLESWNLFDPSMTDDTEDLDKRVYSFMGDLEIELGSLP